MNEPFRARLYRLIFWMAAVYNICFGLWASIWPQEFFDLFQLVPPSHPAIWACLGMVVGLYGVLYAFAAENLERAWPIIAVGLAGKVLGPVGWFVTVASGEWPLRTLTLITFNDIIWWVPFSLFLLEGTRLGKLLRASAPYVCAIVNAVAALALLFLLRGGTELEPDLTLRATFILDHVQAWRSGWLLWYGAAISLLAFYAWWGAGLERVRLALAAWIIALVGLCSDLFAESLFIGWLPENLEEIQGAGTLLTGGIANGLYTVAGIMLTVATPNLPYRLRVLAWSVWVCGVGLSVATFLHSATGMMVAASGLMPLFSCFAWLLGREMK